MCHYFDTAGDHTQAVCAAVLSTVQQNSYSTVVVATTSGATALAMAETLSQTSVKIIAVRHSCGFKQENVQPMADTICEQLEQAGVRVITSVDLLRNIGKAINTRYGGITPDMLIADTLRLFGQGTKVALEVAIMATDVGYVESGETVISVGGTHSGADTAVVIETANATCIFDAKIKKFLTKPVHW